MTNFSIVTVHLQDFEGLQMTLDSLQPLLVGDMLQWVVIDGGSKPAGTAQAALLDRIAGLSSSYVSEPDDGIYDAMNKGTRLAAGDYVQFLNAGDVMHPEFDLQKLSAALSAREPDMWWGTCFDRDRHGNVYRRKSRDESWIRLGMPVNHQAMFFRRDVLGEAPYDPSLRFAADYELVCRKMGTGATVMTSDMPVCIFSLTGSSSKSKKDALAEEAEIRRRHLGLSATQNQAILQAKLLAWRAHEAFPGLRALWRKWL